MKQMKEIISFVISVVVISFVGFLFLNNATITKQDVSIYKEIKYLPSRYLVLDSKEEIKEVIEEDIKEEKINVQEETNVEIEEPIQVKKEEPNEPKVENKVLETLIGKLSGYGPDCYGCTSNHTASGYYVGEGNIYYEDPTYGKVRILAGDSKYPFHTIVKFHANNISSEPIIGIVLDRGGAIGIGEKYLFDLLYTNEKEASVFGVSKNVTFEILRLGK